MIDTQTQMSPPNNGGTAIALAFPEDDDYIRELGDQIANLTLKEAVELSEYLESKGVTSLKPSLYFR